MSHESCVIYMIPESKGLNPHELAHRWGGELWECLARNNSQVSKSGAFATDIIIMIPGSKGLNPHELAHRWGRVVGVLSTEQFVGIKVGDI